MQEALILTFLVSTIVGVVSLNKKVKAGEKNNDNLTVVETIFTWVAGILGPLVSVNGIMYYGLRKKYPIKAKQANKIGLITFVIGIILNILLSEL